MGVLIIIGSTSHACPYLFNLDLVWISWSYQRLFILPYQANFMWSSIGWDSLSQRKLIQNRSVSNARSIWRYELKFRIKHLVNLQIPVSPEQVHRGEPTWSTPNNISKVSPRETAERRHIASRATRYNIWPWLASLFSTAVCSKLLPLLIFPAFEIAFSCSWLSMVVSVSFLVRKSLSSASAGWFSWSSVSQLDATGKFDRCPGVTLLFKKDMFLTRVVTIGVVVFAFLQRCKINSQQDVDQHTGLIFLSKWFITLKSNYREMRSVAWDKVRDNDGIKNLSSIIIDISGRNLRLKEQKNVK